PTRSPPPAAAPPSPTRRSSDLGLAVHPAFGFQRRDAGGPQGLCGSATNRIHHRCSRPRIAWAAKQAQTMLHRIGADKNDVLVVRSEEHTSELQSRENLVCRLQL